jgi:hypothetical protein
MPPIAYSRRGFLQGLPMRAGNDHEFEAQGAKVLTLYSRETGTDDEIELIAYGDHVAVMIEELVDDEDSPTGERHASTAIDLTIDQARAIRDWLDRVLPPPAGAFVSTR